MGGIVEYESTGFFELQDLVADAVGHDSSEDQGTRTWVGMVE